MWNTHSVLLAVLSVMTINCLSCSAVLAQNEETLATSYVWYDGDQERTVWLNPNLMGEFNPSPAGAATLNSVAAGAQPLSTPTPEVRLWQLGKGKKADVVTRQMQANAGTERYSPVLHVGPNPSSEMLLLPGNVIVLFQPSWDQTTVARWVGTRKLEIVRKLDIGANAYVLKTGPGLESLETANALYRSGEVLMAYPNWWKQVDPF